MKLTQFLRGMFLGEWPAPLRNVAGGLAFIQPHGEQFGSGVLTGHVVRTMRLTDGAFWLIDPPQRYVAAIDMTDSQGRFAAAGSRICAIALHDSVLQPIGSPGEGEQDETLAWKRVPGPELIPLPVREMTRE